MELVRLGLLAVGVLLIAVGVVRARGPWQRIQALKVQDENVARYEAWRGGVRDSGPTGASIAMQILRRQMQIGVGLAVAGGVLVLVALVLG